MSFFLFFLVKWKIRNVHPLPQQTQLNHCNTKGELYNGEELGELAYRRRSAHQNAGFFGFHWGDTSPRKMGWSYIMGPQLFQQVYLGGPLCRDFKD